MKARLIFFFCSWAAVAGNGQLEIELEPDKPSELVEELHTVTLSCCYKAMNKVLGVLWIASIYSNNNTEAHVKTSSDRIVMSKSEEKKEVVCHKLELKEVTMGDSGFYQCLLNHSSMHVRTHGTYLQVYKPMRKILKISENAKNKILTLEGILLLLCVLVPGAMLICKTKKLNELEKKNKKEEAENIYEGLNLEECNTTYHQIQRSEVHGPYQDVDNTRCCAEEDEIQLEKP